MTATREHADLLTDLLDTMGLADSLDRPGSGRYFQAGDVPPEVLDPMQHGTLAGTGLEEPAEFFLNHLVRREFGPRAEAWTAGVVLYGLTGTPAGSVAQVRLCHRSPNQHRRHAFTDRFAPTTFKHILDIEWAEGDFDWNVLAFRVERLDGHRFLTDVRTLTAADPVAYVHNPTSIAYHLTRRYA